MKPDAALTARGPAGLLAWWHGPQAPAAVLALGLLALYGPTAWERAAATLQGGADFSHEPVIALVAGVLAWRRRAAWLALPSTGSSVLGWSWMALGLLVHFLGRTQGIPSLETGSLLFVASGLATFGKGWRGLWTMAFPIAFLVFAVPLPLEWVIMLTQPLKQAVSATAVALLTLLDYPVGRSGVVITIGQYQLLVTEACAGLRTMFTLEALGLLYASLMNHASAVRNVLLAVLALPVSFFANVVRVAVLSLVTYHFGDAVGRSFVHGFAGLLLFGVALTSLVLLDMLLGVLLARRKAAP